MFKKIIFIFFNLSCAFKITPLYNNQIITYNNEFINKNNINCLIKDELNYKIIENIIHLKLPNNKELGRTFVEFISSSLPHVDSIGHKVLHANNEFISYILNLQYLESYVKKDIVLASIKLAIMGDNFGSTLLQLYYDIVEKCL